MTADRPKSEPNQGIKKPNPVEKDFQMRIDKDGQWFHEGGVIKRPALVKLFSSVLSCDADGQHWLRTPVEFGKIEVEDAAFVITKAERQGTGKAAKIYLSDNIERVHLLSPETPLVFRKSPIKPYSLQPYLLIDKGLSAKISRPVYYQMADYIGEEGEISKEDGAGIWSDGVYFAFPIEDEDV
jgi:hypothetical protein